jgi:hypothetical protein
MGRRDSMLRNLTRSSIAAAILVALVGSNVWCSREALADDEATEEAPSASDVEYEDAYLCRPWEYGDPALFYNFYTPGYCNAVPAELYLAPRPVPPLVGHTYYTYQPLMPHEFMYPHSRTYRKWYNGGRGMTRTRATWYRGPVTTPLKSARNAVRLPR